MTPPNKLWCQVCGEVAPDQFLHPMTWWVYYSSACVTKFGRREAMKVMEQKVQLLRR